MDKLFLKNVFKFQASFKKTDPSLCLFTCVYTVHTGYIILSIISIILSD